jgi:DNA-binding GntR family transcriptional regulator
MKRTERSIIEKLSDDTDAPPTMLRERAYQEIKHLLFASPTLSEPFLSQQGIAVRELRTREIIEHYEIRQALEPYVIRRIAGHLTVDQEQSIRQNLAQQKSLATGNDILQTTVLDTEFHLLFCQFLDNQEIYRTMLQLRDKIHRVILRMAQVSPERSAASCQEHVDLSEAVFLGEADRAAGLMYAHLEHGKQKLLPGGHW